MKNKFMRLTVFAGMLMFAVAACQVSSSKAPVITAENADQLTAALQTSGSGLISDLVWANDSSTLTTVSNSGAVRYDGSSLETMDAFLFEAPAELYAASADGKTIAFSDDSYSIFFVDITVTENACSIYSPDWVGAIDFSPNGETLLATSMDQIKVTLWDIACGSEYQSFSGFETAAPVYSAKYGEDGQHIIWMARGTVQLTDIVSQSMGPSLGHEDFVVSTALAPDGSTLATAAFGSVGDDFLPIIYLWDADSGESLAELTHSEPYNAVTFSPDSNLLTAVSDGTILIWNLASQQLIAEITSGMDSIVDLAFSPDGTSLAAAGMDGRIELWQVP